ncbi:MAG: undecaprenyldiphospho-muramoylpentapeptide beta-N-acetylglucosaminyltransferase [Deltaproteobacteria bacterium CG11_big_fil_rev_8_21_14_0_20_47_16]|nr:MAG: undecaprenyldiphospho-muramoylpentapeptide beta-N-acetylglucosaminyltransferase [Deltaproteobacteria bacterium CG11_big_fil_rev_8_21_14_0_20_47_16]
MHVIIAGGGTGGHVYPAIAIAEAVKMQFPEAKVTFIGTSRGLEVTAVPKAGWPLALINVRPIKGRSLVQRFMGGLTMVSGVAKARILLKRLKPDLVIGVGGYASAAAGVAAVSMGVPLVIHEQNSIPGLTNRLLGRIAKKVFITFPQAANYFSPSKVVPVGNPVRQQVLADIMKTTSDSTSSEFVVFVFGGSQGARSLNQAMLAALPYLKTLSRPLRVVHQVGSQADEKAIANVYRQAGVNAEVHQFIHDMGHYYRQADVVVARSGAGTLAELALVGKPAILVPYPFASDNHQEANAQAYVSEGAARLIPDQELDGPRLAGELKGLLEDHLSRKAMGTCMKQMATPNAAVDIVNEGMRLLNV